MDQHALDAVASIATLTAEGQEGTGDRFRRKSAHVVRAGVRCGLRMGK